LIEHAFMKSLFHGVIAEGIVFPYPTPSDDESDGVHRLLDGVRKLSSPGASAIGEPAVRAMRQLGLFGLSIPKEHGGLGLSPTAHARVVQEVATVDLALAVTLVAHEALGAGGLLRFGTEAQKKAYLPKIASGETLAAFALTEAGSGSDAASVQTHAELAPGGQTYRIAGSKAWVTNGGLADVFTVFARTSPREEGTKPKITAFLVERRMGVRVGASVAKSGARAASVTPLYLDDVTVPASSVLGERARGFGVAAEVLNDARPVLAAACLGLCRKLVRLSIERAAERRAFGRPIGEFGLVKDKVAVMMADTFALESMIYLTTGLREGRAEDFSLESAICRVAAAETLRRVAEESAQIAASAGVVKDSTWDRLLEDSRFPLFFDATNETLRCFIALSGMQGPGKALVEVARAMREPIKGFGLVRDFAVRKARTALGRERLSRAHPTLSREAVLFEELTADLARNVEKALRKHGTNIHEMQYTLRRVSDLAIDLYGVAASLARTSRALDRRGEEGARREVDLTTMFVAAAERRMREAVASFERNDDELRKAIASKAYADGGYPFDVV